MTDAGRPSPSPSRQRFPPAGYVFEWPLLLACIAWLILLRRPRAGELLSLPAAVATFLIAPVFLLGLLSDSVATLPNLGSR